MQITTIGLDIAKNVFQVHGIDAAEKVVVRKQLRRSQVLAFFKALPPCLIGMEALRGRRRSGGFALVARHLILRHSNPDARHQRGRDQHCFHHGKLSLTVGSDSNISR